MPLVRNRRSSYIDEGRAGVHRPSLKQDSAKTTKLTLIERGSKGKAGGCPPPCTREELEARHTSVHTRQTGWKGGSTPCLITDLGGSRLDVLKQSRSCLLLFSSLCVTFRKGGGAGSASSVFKERRSRASRPRFTIGHPFRCRGRRTSRTRASSLRIRHPRTRRPIRRRSRGARDRAARDLPSRFDVGDDAVHCKMEEVYARQASGRLGAGQSARPRV